MSLSLLRGRCAPCCSSCLRSTEFCQFHVTFISFSVCRSLGFPQREGHMAELPLRLCQTPCKKSPTPLVLLCQRQEDTGRGRGSSSCSSASHPRPSTAVATATAALCSAEATGHHCRCPHGQTPALSPAQLALTQQQRPRTAPPPGRRPPKPSVSWGSNVRSGRGASPAPHPASLPHAELAPPAR